MSKPQKLFSCLTATQNFKIRPKISSTEQKKSSNPFTVLSITQARAGLGPAQLKPVSLPYQLRGQVTIQLPDDGFVVEDKLEQRCA